MTHERGKLHHTAMICHRDGQATLVNHNAVQPLQGLKPVGIFEEASCAGCFGRDDEAFRMGTPLRDRLVGKRLSRKQLQYLQLIWNHAFWASERDESLRIQSTANKMATRAMNYSKLIRVVPLGWKTHILIRNKAVSTDPAEPSLHSRTRPALQKLQTPLTMRVWLLTTLTPTTTMTPA